MQTTDELFADEGAAAFHDVVVQALNLSEEEAGILNESKLRQVFAVLPEPVRDVAYEWGFSDSVFKDNAVFYMGNRPSTYRAILSLPMPKFTP